MNVVAYTKSFNEEALMPFFIEHYRKFCSKIVVYDHGSTDKTRDIVRSYNGTELRPIPEDKFDEKDHVALKNQCYKETRGAGVDYCVVLDVDEFIYHPDMLRFLESSKRDGVTLFCTDGYNMVGDKMPARGHDLCQQIRSGVPSKLYSKRVMFDPRLDINFRPGSHSCRPRPKRDVRERSGLKLLHYRFLCPEYVEKRNKGFRDRVVERCRTGCRRWFYDKDRIRETYLDLKKRRKNIVRSPWQNVVPYWYPLNNLGDEWINRHLFGEIFPEIGDPRKTGNFVMTGIGSILGHGRKFLKDKIELPRIVFGSGFQYGRPQLLPEGSYVGFVRGEYTARQLKVSKKYAVGDGALLMINSIKRSVDPFRKEAVILKHDGKPRGSDVFTARIDTTLIDWMRRLWSYERVSCDALHAAIIADAYGIPWAPMRWERKWADHFGMLGITSRPKGYVLSDRSILRERIEIMEDKVECIRSFVESARA